MFGIRPGTAFEEGRRLARQAGFEDAATPFTFMLGSISFKLLVDETGIISGMMLETSE